jgi:uncharacterized protein YecT (DUF1311 family)
MPWDSLSVVLAGRWALVARKKRGCGPGGRVSYLEAVIRALHHPLRKEGIFMAKIIWTVLALLIWLPATVPASAAGLPVVGKSIVIKTKDIDVSVKYPQTGNPAIDAAVLAYARRSVNEFKASAVDKSPSEDAYTMQITYTIERNDSQMLALVFTKEAYSGGAHPGSDYATLNFLLPDGAQVFLPEIVDGSRGIARISSLATSILIRTIGTGTGAASDPDTIKGGAGPLADNFKDFVWLPNRLHIYFPPYQVASYAAGAQEVSIPVGALVDVIRPDWRAPSASFDCRKAASPIEHAICADAAVARLDRQVAEAYQVKLHYAINPTDQQKTRQSQRDWLSLRNRSCAGGAVGACLTKYYRDRLAVLTKYPN